ncbi:MAG: histidinol-phosphatase [Rhodoblastus sp.]|nr:MAG: histidinol-phosphatase [Rhodoblastus sp.]
MSAVDFSAFVHQLADAAAEASLPFFRTALGATDKNVGGAFDPVTEADKAAEAAMRRLIAAQFPTHGVVGEEFGARDAGADYVWTLDPIDGTRAFLCGLPLWGTLIGLGKEGAPVYGMMSQPFTRERFFGDGARADWRGPGRDGRPIERRLATRPCEALAEATLMTTSPHLFSGDDAAAFARVAQGCRLVRYGGDCYAYCMLAAGHVDLVVETGLQSYDIAPLIPIIEGAGGVVTAWDGGSAAQGGAVVAAGDARLHAIALARLRG